MKQRWISASVSKAPLPRPLQLSLALVKGIQSVEIRINDQAVAMWGTHKVGQKRRDRVAESTQIVPTRKQMGTTVGMDKWRRRDVAKKAFEDMVEGGAGPFIHPRCGRIARIECLHRIM